MKLYINHLTCAPARDVGIALVPLGALAKVPISLWGFDAVAVGANTGRSSRFSRRPVGLCPDLARPIIPDGPVKYHGDSPFTNPVLKAIVSLTNQVPPAEVVPGFDEKV